MSTSPEQQAMGDAFDRHLANILKNADKAPPTAALLAVIGNRLRTLGVTSPIRTGTAAGDLVDKAKQRGLKFEGRRIPDVSAEDDRATGT